ncbi:MAG: DoxX family protein [Planctomycetes bacterium]|nr:DoxX family protein [Planctomycetota bacterium]
MSVETTEAASEVSERSSGVGFGGIVTLVARLVVGGMFVYLSIKKITGLPEFHKVLKTYGLPIDPPWVINGIAMYLPFLELVLGVALIIGLFRRSAFLIIIAMLVFFTFAVYSKGSDISAEKSIAFCDVAFDCGCGTGVVNLCRKLGENIVLLVLSVVGVISGSHFLAADVLWSRRVRASGT